MEVGRYERSAGPPSSMPALECMASGIICAPLPLVSLASRPFSSLPLRAALALVSTADLLLLAHGARVSFVVDVFAGADVWRQMLRELTQVRNPIQRPRSQGGRREGRQAWTGPGVWGA